LDSNLESPTEKEIIEVSAALNINEDFIKYALDTEKDLIL
jgi:hypothetical protein